MTNEIIEYMTEQYPDILDSLGHAVMTNSPETDYLQGVTEAYEHIIEKFGSLYEAS